MPHNYITLIGGLLLIVYSICMMLFPPKFGNLFYGVYTKWTDENRQHWAEAQRLFAISILIIGSILSLTGSFKFAEKIPDIAMFMALIAFSVISKKVVYKILSKKYSL